jgi:hypothetical protein
MAKSKKTKSKGKRYKKPVPLTAPVKISIKPGEPVKLNMPNELINADNYVVVKYWGEKSLYGWVACKNRKEEISVFDSKNEAYDWLANHKKDLIDPNKYIVLKYLNEKWLVCKNINEKISQAFDSKEKAYEWLQNYEKKQASKKHLKKSIIVPDYWL